MVACSFPTLACPLNASTHFLLCRADHLRSVELCSVALQVACSMLSSGSGGASAAGGGASVAASGTFVTKLWAGGEQQQLLADMRSRYGLFTLFPLSLAVLHPQCVRSFATVKPCKPPSSRPESVEMFFVCQGFKRAYTA